MNGMALHGERKVILALVGYGGSGKTSTARFLVERYGFQNYSFSDEIRQFARENGIPLNSRVDFANTHKLMIAQRGWDFTIRKALALESERICMDDVRLEKYIALIRQHGGK